MDWGLLRRDRRSMFGVSLRQPLLVTKRRWVYGVLCVFNLTLRFAWALSIFGGTHLSPCYPLFNPTESVFNLDAVTHRKRAPLYHHRNPSTPSTRPPTRPGPQPFWPASVTAESHPIPPTGVQGRGAGMFFFEFIEIIRRTVWAVFRIEWEVVVKVWRSITLAHRLAGSTSRILAWTFPLTRVLLMSGI